MLDVDYTRDNLLDDYAKSILRERYMTPDEVSPQDAFARAALAFADDIEHAQRMYDYVSKHWMMFSTPILSNAGTQRGLPISCFLNYVPDSREGLNAHWSENTWLASMGGGIGGYWGDVRSDRVATSKGSQSTGHIPFLHVVDSQILAISQGTTRRGSYAAYQNISHPEIEEFISMRKPTGGDINRRCLNLHHGINITDEFMQVLDDYMEGRRDDDNWPLIDPHSGEVRKVVSAKRLWEDILTMRAETGEPYVHFVDTTNRLSPLCHSTVGLDIKQSNLCTEIVLPTDEYRTAVCCLSSVNLEYYDDWKDTGMVADLTRFLDNVLDFFIKNAPKGMEKAVYSAQMERSLGIGAMGFHSYLQSKLIPFESPMAVGINKNMFETIQKQAEAATEQLGKERGNAPDYQRWLANGAPEDARSYRRNVHITAVAPNASSSILCGNTSPSVEPYRANVFNQKTLNGTHTHKNKYLDEWLQKNIMSEGYRDIAKIWKSINAHQGSVQHLDEIPRNIKDVFKTAVEIDQNWIVELAAHRQEYITQAQSINLFFPGVADKAYLFNVHYSAWKKGVKTLYYYRTEAISRADNVELKFDRYDHKITDEECLSCEG